MNVVGNTFFETMGIPMIARAEFWIAGYGELAEGGGYQPGAGEEAISECESCWKAIQDGDDADEWVQIVGVCADTRYANLRDDASAAILYAVCAAGGVGGMTYAIRTKLPVAELVPALRRVVQGADRDLPIIDIRTQQEQIDANMQMERLFAALTVGFGVLALALGLCGDLRDHGVFGGQPHATRSGYGWRWARSRDRCGA